MAAQRAAQVGRPLDDYLPLRDWDRGQVVAERLVLAPSARRVCYEPSEILCANNSFRVLRNRVEVPHDTLVIARHAAWPWPEELDGDLRAKRSRAMDGDPRWFEKAKGE